jgi:hypothetical protein
LHHRQSQEMNHVKTMPATLSPTMPSPPPFTSAMPHPVLEAPYVTLKPLIHANAIDTHHTAQATRAQTRPAPARIGMDARQDASGRVRAPPCPIDPDLPLALPRRQSRRHGPVYLPDNAMWTRSPCSRRHGRRTPATVLPCCEEENDATLPSPASPRRSSASP